METSRPPVAIVTSGGGMKCAYSAGAIVALAKELNITNPDIYVSASGSVASMFYYLAGQYDEIERAWTQFLPSNLFIQYAPLPAMRINYLIDTIFKTYVPLDTDHLQASATKYFVPLTDLDTGETKFVSNEQWFDPYEVMRAAKAIPILYNKPVRLGGDEFVDGDISTGMMTLIQKAIDSGARRILCITNTEEQRMLAKAIVWMYTRTVSKQLRAVVLADMRDHKPILWPDGTEFVCLSPSYPSPNALFTRNRRKTIETFRMGYDDLMAKKDAIQKLFGV